MWLRAFVNDLLEIRGISNLTEEQMESIIRWFGYWFDDSYDTFSDCLSHAFKEIGIEWEEE